LLLIDWREAMRHLSHPRRIGSRDPELALAVHRAVAEAAGTMLTYGAARTGVRTVALTGGVFQNRILTRLLIDRLHHEGLGAVVHRSVPPNDGGISVGQVYAAALGWYTGRV